MALHIVPEGAVIKELSGRKKRFFIDNGSPDFTIPFTFQARGSDRMAGFTLQVQSDDLIGDLSIEQGYGDSYKPIPDAIIAVLGNNTVQSLTVPGSYFLGSAENFIVRMDVTSFTPDTAWMSIQLGAEDRI